MICNDALSEVQVRAMRILGNAHSEKLPLLDIYYQLDALAIECKHEGDMEGYNQVYEIIVYMSNMREMLH